MRRLLCTIGYERATPQGLVAALKDAGVTRLVDVRELANSRRPGFAKRSLSATLADAGIAYEHARALGTPAAGRAEVRAGRPAAMKPIFLRHLAGTEAQAALARLADQVLGEPICVLCLEADPAHCHRSLVADAVADRLAPAGGLAIRHLHPGS